MKTFKTAKQIRNELAVLIHLKVGDEKNEKVINRIVNECRQEMNVKYGSDWRNGLYTNT